MFDLDCLDKKYIFLFKDLFCLPFLLEKNKMDNRVDHANPFTNQIFQEAVIRNDMAIAKLLLKYGIHPKRGERNRQGLTALQQCVLDGSGRMAILFLESGADIESKTSNGWTCLHIASALGDLDMLATLVNHCCDLVALTKNEELPIDLAASRDIKIKLAKEMSRVGYSELAQWYMRKLAAREGVFYVISADALLDLACDDKQERNYNDDYSYYARQYNNQQREMYIHSPVRKPPQESSSSSYRVTGASPKRDFWMENSTQEQTKYLTFSSGYLSEVIFDPASGQYSKALGTASAVLESPQRKQQQHQVVEEKVPLASISEVDGPPTPQASATTPAEETKSRSGTLKRTPSNKRHSQNMSRKQSTIEMYIDYSHTTESDSDEDGDNNDNDDSIFTSENIYEQQQQAMLQQNNRHRDGGYPDTYSPGHHHHHRGVPPPTSSSYEQRGSSTTYNNRTSPSDRFEGGVIEDHQYGVSSSNSTGTLIIKDVSSSATRMAGSGGGGSSSTVQPTQEYSMADVFGTTPPNNNTSTWSSSGSGGNKSRNVKFDPDDKNNEFCNCPTCKKLGYAFSPDIQVDSRKPFHSKANAGSSDALQPIAGFNQFYYPETTTEKGALYYDQGGYGADYKPRKRKKKLFSGIKSMFKDSIKVRTNMEPSPACDDAGILFSVSVRDRNKAKQIRQRHDVRRSNSFSGIENTYRDRDPTASSVNHGDEDEVSVLSHSQVVAPPPKFSDIYHRDSTTGNYNDTKMESIAAMKSYEKYQQQQQQQMSHPYLAPSQLQPQQQQREGPPHVASRNTYERRDKSQQQQASNGTHMIVANDSYTEEEINAYYDATTTTGLQQNDFQYHHSSKADARDASHYPASAHHQMQQPPAFHSTTPSLQSNQHNNPSSKYRNDIPKTSTNNDHHHQSSSAFAKVNSKSTSSETGMASSKMTGIETSHHYHNHRESDKVLKYGPNAAGVMTRQEKLAIDNCEYCKTSLPIAGAIPLATAIE